MDTPSEHQLRRPGLLVRAARAGLEHYDRARALKRLLHAERPPSPEKAVDRLAAAEAGMEDARTSGDAAYSVVRHVELLIALMAEMRLLARCRKQTTT